MSEDVGDSILDVDGLSVDVTTAHGPVRVVDDVSFRIPQDGILGLVGESGSGKSMVCKAIARLLPKGARAFGTVSFRGENLLVASRRRLEDLRGAEIGYVFQDPMTTLNPSLSIGTQLAETVRRHRGASRSAARSRAIELLDLVGIPSAALRVDDYPREFSGGMRQRVLIAMAISCDPLLLVADEPTTALDVTVQAQLLELLRAMRERLGLSILFVTHDLGVIADICDEVVVLYGGEVMEQATSEALFASPRHPYTKRLLGALQRTRGVPLVTIPGAPPSPGCWPTGCRFAPRCTDAFERCTTHPGLDDVGGRLVRCHLTTGDDAG